MWAVFTFWLLWIILSWISIYEHRTCSTSFGYTPKGGTAMSRDDNFTFNKVWGFARPSRVAVPFDIPTTNVRVIWFLHSLANTCYCSYLCLDVSNLAGVDGSSCEYMRYTFNFSFFNIYVFYQSTVDLQCFRSTARWFSYTHTHVLFLKLLPIIAYYKILTIVPCAIQ